MFYFIPQGNPSVAVLQRFQEMSYGFPTKRPAPGVVWSEATPEHATDLQLTTQYDAFEAFMPAVEEVWAATCRGRGCRRASPRLRRRVECRDERAVKP